MKPEEFTSVEDEINDILGMDSETAEDDDKEFDADDDAADNDKKTDDDDEKKADETAEDEKASDDLPDEKPVVDDAMQKLIDSNAELLKRVEELSKSKDEVKTEEPVPDTTLEDIFKDLDVDDVTDSTESFTTFLTSFAEVISKNAVAQALKQVPEVATKANDQKKSFAEVRDKFYTDHAELAEVKNYVAQVAGTVASEHSDWTVSQVLEEAAIRSKKALNITEVKEPVKSDEKKEEKEKKKKNPAFAKPQGNRRNVSREDMTDLEKDIADIIDL